MSPLALGTMTFGWGADQEAARAIFDAYIGRGGNFVDTANGYANGAAEEMVGEFAESRREELVIATKYSMPMRSGDPNSGGNSRKSMVRSVEDSLKRLRTDYIDLLYLHIWDGNTPVEEVLRAMDDLVRAGKVLYVGISDIPAWQVSRMQAIAELRGWAPLVALQIPYNLIERTVERDLIPMAETLGLGVVAWSPQAGGVLTGKYGQEDLALAWTLLNPAVVAPIVGARTLAQLDDNLGVSGISLEPEQRARLAEASAVDLGFPHESLRRLGYTS